MVNQIRFQVLHLAAQQSQSESPDLTIKRANAYLQFLEGGDQEQKVPKKRVAPEPVEAPQPDISLEDIQQAGFLLLNERGPVALQGVLITLGAENLRNVVKADYPKALKLLKETLVEGELLV